MSFNAIREDKILAKISGFTVQTVCKGYQQMLKADPDEMPHFIWLFTENKEYQFRGFQST